VYGHRVREDQDDFRHAGRNGPVGALRQCQAVVVSAGPCGIPVQIIDNAIAPLRLGSRPVSAPADTGWLTNGRATSSGTLRDQQCHNSSRPC
jgi:hypothetical protein